MHLLLAAAFGLLLLLPPPGAVASRKPTMCQRCRTLVDKFNQGMANTARKNFGGGNTAWEEKTLSKYEFSEIRLLEIMEGLCDSSDFECNQLLEQQEEQLEAWWQTLKKEHPNLFEWFCVHTLKACCLPGTYGPDCQECQGGSERPCSGNGYCSGDGSRQGDGSCQCHTGYKGPLCIDCTDGFFSLQRNETHSICSACDESCKTCSGPSNKDCIQCEVGWARVEDACVDVDECAAETSPCSDGQYCENVNGSYTCEDCDSTCVGCTGKGPANCKECIAGYTKESGQCTDIDECSLEEKACKRKNENCYNVPGSFVCVCLERAMNQPFNRNSRRQKFQGCPPHPSTKSRSALARGHLCSQGDQTRLEGASKGKGMVKRKRGQGPQSKIFTKGGSPLPKTKVSHKLKIKYKVKMLH